MLFIVFFIFTLMSGLMPFPFVIQMFFFVRVEFNFIFFQQIELYQTAKLSYTII